MLPKLRKSLQKSDKRTSPPTISQKSHFAIAAPKAVIRALYDYNSSDPQELSFSKGDFFHVVNDDGNADWYDVCNPATGVQGLVPAQYFQVLGRNTKESVNLSNPSEAPSVSSAPARQASLRRSTQPSKSSPLYGIVQYDFQAERPDELDAKAGEAIIVIAQSNHEWFVAKPIGRLGGPGLIPVSFIEIRDMSTGQPISNLEEVAARAAVPKVEEWKRAAAEYKNSSIPLGRFDFTEKKAAEAQAAQRTSSRQGSSLDRSTLASRSSSAHALWVARASVDQFLLDGARYWCLVRVEMNDGRHRNLCRYYEDFYDFQIALLDEFPIEAGRTGEQRILPFMPGPLAYVDDTISAQRRADLSVYVEELCALPPHIVKSPLIQQLFAAREGDVESSHPTSMMPQPSLKTSAQRTQSRISANSNHISQRASTVNSQSSQQQQQQQQQHDHVSGHKPQASISMPREEHGTAGKTTLLPNIKIKVFYEDDLIALRVPGDITYTDLCSRLRERLSGTWQSISVKDDLYDTYSQITGNDSFRDFLARTEKVVLYVQ